MDEVKNFESRPFKPRVFETRLDLGVTVSTTAPHYLPQRTGTSEYALQEKEKTEQIRRKILPLFRSVTFAWIPVLSLLGIFGTFDPF